MPRTEQSVTYCMLSQWHKLSLMRCHTQAAEAYLETQHARAGHNMELLSSFPSLSDARQPHSPYGRGMHGRCDWEHPVFEK